MRVLTQTPVSREGRMPGRRAAGPDTGFTLVEMMIALIILVFGLLTAGQMIYASLRSESLARSKGGAALVAQTKLEFLSDLYNRDSAAADLTLGSHGPEQVQQLNPAVGNVLNRFDVSWTVADVPDPRPGTTLKAVQVTVTVAPITAAGARNYRAGLNKIVTITSIFSLRIS